MDAFGAKRSAPITVGGSAISFVARRRIDSNLLDIAVYEYEVRRRMHRARGNKSRRSPHYIVQAANQARLVCALTTCCLRHPRSMISDDAGIDRVYSESIVVVVAAIFGVTVVQFSLPV